MKKVWAFISAIFSVIILFDICADWNVLEGKKKKKGGSSCSSVSIQKREKVDIFLCFVVLQTKYFTTEGGKKRELLPIGLVSCSSGKAFIPDLERLHYLFIVK